MDVGGVSFNPTRLVIPHGDDAHHFCHHKNSADDTTAATLLVAKGKSYLSYFYVGVCSSVLYLPPEIPNNEEAISFLDNSNHNSNNDINTKRKKWNEPSRFSSRKDQDVVIALEIHYHKPVRATELRWATNKFIEANLVESTQHSRHKNNNKIANLPKNIQHHLSSFNSLYRDIKVGDRYTLEYHPEVGIRLYLNHALLGTVGSNHQYDDNHRSHYKLRNEERVDLARIIFSVWFGNKSPFSEVMKRELLTPIVPPVMVLTAENGMPPSGHCLHHNESHHTVVTHASSSSWYALRAQEQHNIGVVLEFLLVLLGVIIALALWKLIKRRKTAYATTIDMKNNSNIHHPASRSYSMVQQLFDGVLSRAMISLTEEEMETFESNGVRHLLTIYYDSLRDVVVSAT